MNAPSPSPRLRPEAYPADEEIVARVRAGDVALFEVLMRRHNTRLYRAVRGILRDEAEVEDAMQQAYLRAYAALGEFEGLSSFSTWLVRIGLNEALGRVRKRRSFVPVEAGEATEGSMNDQPDPEERTASRQALALLESAIDRLPPIHRSVILLREVEGLSTEEAARALGVSEAVVKVRLHRARAALRDVLTRDLGRNASDAFPFPAERCDRIVRAVLARILPAA
ncbi:MAG TPA: RNA polymerase sigma factor [Anaeromyxobacter sp.]|nr:RNA polymerase sigma factor [Anaeromyxobacter sp.]